MPVVVLNVLNVNVISVSVLIPEFASTDTKKYLPDIVVVVVVSSVLSPVDVPKSSSKASTFLIVPADDVVGFDGSVLSVFIKSKSVVSTFCTSSLNDTLTSKIFPCVTPGSSKTVLLTVGSFVSTTNCVRLSGALVLFAPSVTNAIQLYVPSSSGSNVTVVFVLAVIPVVLLFSHPAVPENVSVPSSFELITTSG